MVVSDLQTMTSMLERAGIDFEKRAPYPDYEGRGWRTGTTTEIQVEDMGYPGFVSVFGFDETGALVSVGAWE